MYPLLKWNALIAMPLFWSGGVYCLNLLLAPRSSAQVGRSKSLETQWRSNKETKSSPRQRRKEITANHFEEENFEDFDDPDWNDVTSRVLELQRATGSEILDSNLQSQLEGVSHPDQFLDLHMGNPTYMEKIAMSSVTQQLPKAALDAFSAEEQTRENTKHVNSLSHAKVRVSREEEIELAKIIQRGAALESLKVKSEKARGKSLTKQEWAELAGLSPKELRRQVSNYRQAKHLLVTANVGLVGAVVNQIWNKRKHAYYGISKEELIQEGSLGLLRAAELFDPTRGLRFSTYAVVWIKGVLSNSHIEELVRLPDREKRRWRKIEQALDDLENEEGNRLSSHISMELLSERTGISAKDVEFTYRKMQQAKSLVSLDYEQSIQTRSGTLSGSINKIQNDKSLQEEDMTERTQLRADLIAALARNLDAREGRLMRLRYGLSDGVPRSLTECAEAMGLSYTRVNQLSRGCLKKLREAAEAESLQEYLLTIA